MARGRLLTIELLNDDRLNQMSEKAQRLFLRAWPHLDRDGRTTGNPRRLWAQIDVDHIENMDRMATIIDEWIASGLVMRYESGKGPVLFFTEFRLHNLNLTYCEEAASAWPSPPGWHNTKHGPVPDCPELAERMAENIGVNCHYKTELVRHAQSADNDLFYEAGNHATVAPDYLAKIAELEAKVAELQANLQLTSAELTVEASDFGEPLPEGTRHWARVVESSSGRNLTTNLNRTLTGRQPEASPPVTGREVKDQHQHQDKEHYHRVQD